MNRERLIAIGEKGRLSRWRDPDGRFRSRVAIGSEDECWPWIGNLDAHGYGRLGERLAHRVAWERSGGAIPAGMSVLHTCDNPPCVNPAHLYLGTQVENMRDMVRRGRYRGPTGTVSPKRKLDEEQVAALRAARMQGSSVSELARLFGVSRATAHRIASGTTYLTTRRVLAPAR